MIILSAGCASLAALMRDADRGASAQMKRASVESDRRPRLVSTSDCDQRAVWVSPARHTR